MKDVRVVAVADALEEAARSAADGVGARWYTDYRRLLDKERVDAAYVVTPARMHAGPAVAVAEAGIALFCQKPLAWSIEDGRRIVEAVERNGVIAAVGYQWRYGALVDIAREALGDAPVSLVRAHYYWTVPLVASIRDRNLGGGQVFDQCTHLIDLARYFVGDPATIYASYTQNAVPPEELDNWDGYSVTMSFASGAVASIASTYALFPAIPEPPTLDIAAHNILVRFTPGTLRVFTPDHERVIRRRESADIDRAFIDAVRSNDPSRIRSSPRDALQSLAATLGCNFSAMTGEVVELKEVLAGKYSGLLP